MKKITLCLRNNLGLVIFTGITIVLSVVYYISTGDNPVAPIFNFFRR
jgi:hypothetical protein